MNPLISIITVCFNEADNIRKTCESVMSQTYRNFEWIVIDGGSTDGSVEILENYKNDLAYFVSEKDKGIYNAMNKGLVQAKGNFLLFLNGGDSLFDAETLESVASAIEVTEASADLYYGEMLNQDTGENIYSLKNKKIDLFFFSKIRTLHHQATFVKASLFNKIGMYNESYRIVADYDWWIRYFIEVHPTKIHYLDRVIASFDPKGVSSKPQNRRKLTGEAYKALYIALYRIWKKKAHFSWTFLIKFSIHLIKTRIYTVIMNAIADILNYFGIYDVTRYYYRKYLKRYV